MVIKSGFDHKPNTLHRGNNILNKRVEKINKCPPGHRAKVNVHKRFRRRAGPLPNLLCTFHLRPAPGVGWVRRGGVGEGVERYQNMFAFACCDSES